MRIHIRTQTVTGSGSTALVVRTWNWCTYCMLPVPDLFCYLKDPDPAF